MRAVEKSFPPLVLTGPTGWIGSAFLAALARRGQDWAQGVRLFGSSARDVFAPDGTRLPMRALDTIAPADLDGADIVHLAYLTKDKVDLLGERAFFAANLAIDEAMLNALQAARPRGVFLASSGAAALAETGQDRHPYGICKLLQEDRYLRYGATAGVPIIPARIFNIAGPYINKLESYAIASFLLQAYSASRIRIAARVPVFRSYLHVDDLATLALALLDRGIGASEPIDFCGREILEMTDIARAVAKLVGLGEDAIDRQSVDFDRPSAYLGNPTAMMGLAQRSGIKLRDFVTQLEDTAQFLRI